MPKTVPEGSYYGNYCHLSSLLRGLNPSRTIIVLHMSNLTLQIKTAEEEIEVFMCLSVNFNPTSNAELFFLETITSTVKRC